MRQYRYGLIIIKNGKFFTADSCPRPGDEELYIRAGFTVQKVTQKYAAEMRQKSLKGEVKDEVSAGAYGNSRIKHENNALVKYLETTYPIRFHV